MSVTTIRSDTTARHIAKYSNRNPLHRLSLKRFHDCLATELRGLAPQSVLDFGCGEGFTVGELAERGVTLKGYEGVDLRADAVATARQRWHGGRFSCADIFDGTFDGQQYDVTLALEVFEHLPEPETILERLVALTRHALVLSVPHEPWFQMINLLRGRDFIRLGNHPEHVQHWNPSTFADFVSRHTDIVQIKSSFPFVLATVRPRR